ncbi:Uma2 family endonuclease [Aulosira sp. FACHB-615]|uniref:Uma2 family endonuclease n=1 Tax=Aulosira sp. FACHB-615 TaxID=2692777 RepID=UPI001681F97C|nr:Uma2 family endonuclease [Aulosira sp. FACHB-615]MBD2489156.1 Uma2 family endonuclease [Aulosira sp. FACHB-615]
MTRTLIHWTVEDYHRMIASGLLAGRQVELIDGQILEMPPELPIHRATYRRGVKYLEQLLENQAVIFSAAPITLPNYSEPQPDICVAVPPESRYNERHPEPEDIYWLIEVSNSILAYDLDEKAKLYAKGGIQDYWVLDIVNTQLWVHRNAQNGEYQSIVRVSTGVLTPLALPSIVVEVARLLG